MSIRLPCPVYDYREFVANNEYNCGTGLIIRDVPSDTVFMLVENHQTVGECPPSQIPDLEMLQEFVLDGSIHGGVLVNSGSSPLIFFH